MFLECTAHALELVGSGLGVGNKGLGAVVGKLAGVQTHKSAVQVQVAHRLGQADGVLVFGRAGDHADVATGCTHVGRFGVGGALRDKYLAQVFRVGIFHRVNGKIARVIDRRAIDGKAHLVAVGTAHAQTAAKQAGGVLAKGADAGQQLNRLVRVGSGIECVEVGAVDRTACLGCVFLHDQAGAGAALRAFDRNPADIGGGSGLGPQCGRGTDGGDQQCKLALSGNA